LKSDSSLMSSMRVSLLLLVGIALCYAANSPIIDEIKIDMEIGELMSLSVVFVSRHLSTNCTVKRKHVANQLTRLHSTRPLMRTTLGK
jgi:hypothetical protein